MDGHVSKVPAHGSEHTVWCLDLFDKEGHGDEHVQMESQMACKRVRQKKRLDWFEFEVFALTVSCSTAVGMLLCPSTQHD